MNNSTTKEQLEFRKAWAAALRSGKFTQGKSVLYDGATYCCLGVACVIAGLKPQLLSNGRYYFDGQMAHLPSYVSFLAGIDGAGSHYFNKDTSLVVLNDREAFNFEQIADVIENPNVAWAPPIECTQKDIDAAFARYKVETNVS